MKGRMRLYNVFRKTCLGNLPTEAFVQRFRFWTNSQLLVAHRLHKLPPTPRLNYVRILCDSGKMHKLTQPTSCTNFQKHCRLKHAPSRQHVRIEIR